LLIAFAARVRTGLYGKGPQVGHQSAEKALRHVAQTLQLAGYDNPRKTYGSKELDLPFHHLLKSYKDDNPAPKPQLALPVPVIQTASSRFEHHHSPRDRAISDLVCMAFYFLLCVGKYTMPSPGTITRTVQFRMKDVHLWRNGLLLDNYAPRAELMTADAVTLYSPHVGSRMVLPCQSLVSSHIRPGLAGLRPRYSLSCVSPGIHIDSKNVVTTVREAAHLTGLTDRGYNIKRIGAHLLRASGAMALKLDGVDANTIMKVGRWTSSTFLVYIYSQIAALNAGLAQRMARPIYFQNIGAFLKLEHCNLLVVPPLPGYYRVPRGSPSLPKFSKQLPLTPRTPSQHRLGAP
jgi:hypothetical protein